ncbi:WXG100 family type VII secretion target [Streptomyces sp. KR80]|uniref:WXG100 family type VII secretion target n=1 Tax=Streptomyces sp. KR80 TaxID=3457426 RepID=UPI003FD6A83E
MTRDGNAEALREASAGWREMGKQLDDIVRTLDRGVTNARATHWQGPAAEAFDADWSQLRKSVDEAVPVFELAAADLDAAADRMAESRDPAGADDHHDADQESDQASTPVAYQAAYALMALSQLGASLGSVFGGGRSGGRGRTSLARTAARGASAAPRTADPFGPPEVQEPPKERPSGGLGIARGIRTPGRQPADPSPLDPPAETPERADNQRARGSAGAEPGGRPERTAAGEPPRQSGRGGGADRTEEATGRQQPATVGAQSAQSAEQGGPPSERRTSASLAKAEGASGANPADSTGQDTERRGAFG